MSSVNKKFAGICLLSIIGLLPCAASADEPAKPDAPSAKADAQIVITTGATNPGKTTVKIESDGSAVVTGYHDGTKASGKLSDSLMEKLNNDIKRAMPLSQLPPSREIKSASFGTRTFIGYGNEHSPDIASDSAGDPRVKALCSDIELVLKELSEQKK